MSVDILPFVPDHAGEAARAFMESLTALRRQVPMLPATLDAGSIEARLAGARGFVALDGGRLVGYLTSIHPIANIRHTPRVGAYVPEWGHHVWSGDTQGVYAGLHRAAAEEWVGAGCSAHAISILQHRTDAIDAWFRAGFGAGTLDGIRPTEPLKAAEPEGIEIRRATSVDATGLAEIDREHVVHYTRPPTSMAPPTPFTETDWTGFLEIPGNSAWLAIADGRLVGFMRFDTEFNGASVTRCDDGVFISGAFVRPTHRGRGIAPALLDAGLVDAAEQGFVRCAVDFESFNPEAAAFWPHYFAIVCTSLMRVPEWP